MPYLIFILVALVLLAGFYALTGYEVRRGMRLFAPARMRLDRDVERVEFIFAHVDFAAFTREETRRLISRAGHDLAHLSLRLVRAIERLLTRLVRYLRSKQSAVAVAPRETSREFVKTLSDFKGKLAATRPEIPEIH